MNALPARGLKQTTVENYTALLRQHVIPQLGHKRLDELTPHDVQKWVNGRRASGTSDRTVQLSFTVLRQALAQPVRWGEARRNVAALVDRPRVGRRDAAHLTVEQAQAFLDAARGERLEAFFSIAIACGLRRGEALALRWSDVSTRDLEIRVARTLSRTKQNGLEFTEPKTQRSRRTVPVPYECVRKLTRHRRAQRLERVEAGSLWQENDLVFPSRLGTPLDPRNALRACHEVGERAGLGPVKLHTLRHTCASLLLAQDVHPRVVMETLGHSGISITMDVYSHVIPEQQHDAAALLGDVLRF